jgi:hypothetical protein
MVLYRLPTSCRLETGAPSLEANVFQGSYRSSPHIVPYGELLGSHLKGAAEAPRTPDYFCVLGLHTRDPRRSNLWLTMEKRMPPYRRIKRNYARCGWLLAPLAKGLYCKVIGPACVAAASGIANGMVRRRISEGGCRVRTPYHLVKCFLSVGTLQEWLPSAVSSG